jgi:hypothetical protein
VISAAVAAIPRGPNLDRFAQSVRVDLRSESRVRGRTVGVPMRPRHAHPTAPRRAHVRGASRSWAANRMFSIASWPRSYRGNPRWAATPDEKGGAQAGLRASAVASRVGVA